MTEPPRPPGEGNAGYNDPTSSPPQSPGSYSAPGEQPGYAPPPAGGAGYPPPTSGAGYGPPPGAPYQQPAAGGYGAPPPGSYQQPAGPAPAGYASNDDKTWALVAHFGGALGMLIGAGAGGWVAPLIALLAKGNQSPTVRAHAVAALNFQILWSIVGIIGWALTCIFVGIIAWLAAMVLGIVFGIIAGLRANEGQLYKYPMSVNIIK
jgi:uncharacterized Tic20 family protein